MRELHDTCPFVVMICEGSKCSRNQRNLRKTFKHELKERGLKPHVELVEIECTSRCKQGPIIAIQPHNLWLGEVRESDVPELLDELFTPQ
ncbi:MAG: (2Fe-2S) ferredoxin domain-containing protein [Siphonobacter sp.]